MRMAVAIGLNTYKHLPHLTGCVADAKAITELLERHANNDVNYDCSLFTSESHPNFRSENLRAEAERILTLKGVESAVFYFAGHGSRAGRAGTLLTAECMEGGTAFMMAELIGMANVSDAREVVIILDCCRAGAILDELTILGTVPLREGVSVLAACRGTETANEINGRGVYTSHICEALKGGAADVRGYVTVVSIYAYVCEVISSWKSRPLLKTSLSKVAPIRRAGSAISDENLRRLVELFESPDFKFKLEPKHEPTLMPRDEVAEEQFSVLQRYRAARLLVPVGEEHMYYAAMNSKHCELTPLGKFYWSAVKAKKI